MKWRKFEKKIKQNLNQHQSQVQVSDIWSKIDSKVSDLNKNRRKRPSIIALWTSVSLLAILLFYLAYFSLQNKDIHTNSLNISQKQGTIKKPSQIDRNYKKNKKGIIVVDNFDKKKSRIAVNEKVQDTLISNKNLSVENIRNFQNSYLESKIAINNHQNSNTTIVDKVKDNDSKKSLNSWTPHKTFTDKAAHSSIAKKMLEDSLKYVKISSHHKKDILYLSSIDLKLKDSIITQKHKVAINDVELYEPQFSKRLFAFNVSAYGGISQIRKILQTEQSTTTLNRTNTEALLEAIHYGLQLGLEHRSGLEFGIGFQRTIINERFEYQAYNTQLNLIEGTEFLRVKLDGDIQELAGTISSTTTTTMNKKIYNQYEFYDIPMTLAYHKNMGLWKVGLRMGLIANLSLNTKGQILLSSGEVADIGENQNQFFKDKVAFGYTMSLPIRRYLTRSLSLNIEPTLQMSSNITVNSYTDTQKYNLLGIRLGLVYRIK